MRRGKILSLCLLSLFVISVAMPVILVNTRVQATNHSATITQKNFFDVNGDKIQDEFLREIEAKSYSLVEAVVKYDRPITDLDRFRLANEGVIFADETWDLGTRTLITVYSENLKEISSLPGVSLITAAEKRTIAVGIDGSDFSDLVLLEQFDDTLIFNGVGIAIIKYYSGIENDINLLGDYTLISDITDVYYYHTARQSTTSDYSTDTAETADDTNATALWDDGYKGGTASVGVIDTGINDAHGAFSGRVIDAQSFVLQIYDYDFDDATITDYDSHGHGSHVSGIVGADDSVDPDYVGMAPEVNLYMGKIGDHSQDRSPATASSIIAAVDWLADTKNVDVINFSYGGGDGKGVDIVELAFKNAVRNEGCICVTSIGNEGDEGIFTTGSPGAGDDIIGVGWLDQTLSPFAPSYASSRGLTADSRMKPDVLAPGQDITSCSKTGDGWNTLMGSSMASPHVAGAAALLVDACHDQGISVNPGLIKAALMASATELQTHDPLRSGRGYIDVGQAWHIIKNTAEVNGYPHIGAVNPTDIPLPVWSDLIQGQIAEYYLTCVTPYTSGLSLDISGTAAQFITHTAVYNHWTTIFKIVITINATTPLGIYTGSIDLVHDSTVLDTTDVNFEVFAGLGKRVLMNTRTTDWPSDKEKAGQFVPFIDDIYSEGYSICEQDAALDSGILDSYDAVWLPDPFDLAYPNIQLYDTTAETYNPWTTSEKAALTAYVQNGGSVILLFNGFAGPTSTIFGTIDLGTNVSVLNEWTTQWGITISDAVYGDATVPIPMKGIHALAAGVAAIDHTGTTMTLTGNATGLTETTGGDPYNIVAVYQDASGGRVVVISSNFMLDSAGYVNGYNPGYTNNDQFGRNLVRWATAEHRIERVNISSIEKTITLRYKYIAGPGAAFGGYVIKPDSTQENLVWNEITTDVWEATITNVKEGIHEFYVECGTAGTDEFDYYKYNYIKTGGLGIELVVVGLISILGLAGLYFIQKKRKM